MTQKEITLLFTDTCGRLKSNLICRVVHKDSEGWKEEDMVLSGIIDNEGYFTTENGSAYSSEFKPYLRPLSSITEEESVQLTKTINRHISALSRTQHLQRLLIHCGSYYWKEVQNGMDKTTIIETAEDFYNAHHLDYRGLIPMGLALEAKEGMYD